MSNRDKLRQVDIDLELKRLRESLPGTQALKESILNQTKDLPQESYGDEEYEVVKHRRFLWPSLIASAACLAMIAVMVNFLEPAEPSLLPTKGFVSAEDMEFQELMLLQDELIFAQL